MSRALDPDRIEPPGAAATVVPPLLALAAAGGVLALGADVPLFRAVNAWPGTTGDLVWSNLTRLGEAVTLLALSACLIGRRPALLWALALAAALGGLVVHPIKDGCDVPRPVRVLGADHLHVIGPILNKRSFPSGHATTAFAAAAFAWAASRRAWLRAAALAAAALVALSRLAVGAHWPSDVLGGAALGWVCAAASLRLAARWRWGTTARGQAALGVLPLAAALVILVAAPDDPRSRIAQLLVAGTSLLVGIPAWVRLRRRAQAT